MLRYWFTVAITLALLTGLAAGCGKSSSDCGDGVCAGDETAADCPADCFCGNGSCEADESMNSCSGDCVAPVCGNGDCEPAENMVNCPGDCTTPVCGNTACEPGEDGQSCPADCAAECGNGVLEEGEQCDGVVPDGPDCLSQTGKPDGVIGCDTQCELDTSNCSECGDGVREGDEECDGADLGGATCESLSYPGGALACTASCTFDTAGCLGCGDGLCDRATESAVTCAADCGWTQVTAGHHTTCGLRADGSAWCWGFGELCQLGDGACVSSATPVQVSGLSGVTLISTAHGYTTTSSPIPTAGHSCALAGGQLYCWGDNYRAQLGDGTQTGAASPIPVSLPNVVDVAAGGRNTCAVVSGGDTYCWGQLQMGLGVVTAPDTCQTTWGPTFPCALTPLLVPNTPSAVEVDASHSNGCILTTGGEIWCWGRSFACEPPQTGYCMHFDAFQIPGSAGAVALSRGNSHGCHRNAAGDLWCWGFNEFGQLGTGAADYGSRAAVQASVISGVDQIGAGGDPYDWVDYAHTCVSLVSDGSVRCWGYNAEGQLGDGTFTDSLQPVTVAGVTDVVQMDGGTRHTCAVTGAGRLYCWGGNYFGELGNGSTASSNVAVEVE